MHNTDRAFLNFKIPPLCENLKFHGHSRMLKSRLALNFKPGFRGKF
ncbi:hypothetical protein CAMGR0001_1004 [Campylobacter gracilis RM3268]|uniref:Uncharacterized protein n=1 Tax=Campylobacter gracilis RM3268 TaxID=553220 RepID=C8PGL0_9BACT|nr:hypothetical protein CAMGR0001_1004 [Campylobacter gracilis RM3268]